jgi:hypothetical protein
LNPRSRAPKARALPGYATPRGAEAIIRPPAHTAVGASRRAWVGRPSRTPQGTRSGLIRTYQAGRAARPVRSKDHAGGGSRAAFPLEIRSGRDEQGLDPPSLLPRQLAQLGRPFSDGYRCRLGASCACRSAAIAGCHCTPWSRRRRLGIPARFSARLWRFKRRTALPAGQASVPQCLSPRSALITTSVVPGIPVVANHVPGWRMLCRYIPSQGP